MQFRLEQRFSAPVEAAFLDPRLLAELATLPQLGRPELLSAATDGGVVTREIRDAFAGELSPAGLARPRLTPLPGTRPRS